MLDDTSLAWLAGIWDGEGSILLQKQKRTKEKIQISPCVYVGNTDLSIMIRVKEILGNHNLSFHWQEKNLKSGKIFFVLQTTNFYTIQKFLGLINPYLVGSKQAYGKMVLEYVSNRINKAKLKGITLKQLKYDEKELEFIRSSTTTCETSTDEDIVYS